MRKFKNIPLQKLYNWYCDGPIEITTKAGNLRGGSEPARQYLEPLIIKEGEHIGDIGSEYKVYKSNIQNAVQFGIYSEDNSLATLFNGVYINNKMFELKQMITKQEFSGQHLSAKLLIFLKTREKLSIQIGDTISNDNFHNFEKIAKQVPTLNIKWLNIQSGEKEEFLNKDKYSEESEPNEWRILIENNMQGYTSDTLKFSHFYIQEDYFDYSRDYNKWFLE